MKKLFLIIGAPGSGKTTDASIIAEKNDNIVHYSTGDMLREEVGSGSELGKEIESYISKGALVPLEIIVNTIVSAINNAPVANVLIDGYPRSVEQMIAFDKLVAKEDNIERNIPLLVPYIGLYTSLYVTSPAFLLKSGRERLDGGGGTGDGVYRRRAL